MPNCAVSTCSNHHRKTKGSKIVYYGFPRNPHIREAWIQFCCRKDDFKIEFGRICSIHFRQDSFKRDLKAELLGLQERLRLKPDAIPTENKPDRYKFKNMKKSGKSAADTKCITKVWVREEKINQSIFLTEEEPLFISSFEEDDDNVEKLVKEGSGISTEEENGEKVIKEVKKEPLFISSFEEDDDNVEKLVKEESGISTEEENGEKVIKEEINENCDAEVLYYNLKVDPDS